MANASNAGERAWGVARTLAAEIIARMEKVAAPTRAPRPRTSPFARLRGAIPPEPAAPPVTYSPLLVAYAAALLLVAAVLAVITVRGPVDLGTMGVGAAAIVALDLVLVRSFGGVRGAWSPTVFVHLALAFSVGPTGALVSAVAGGAARTVRLRMTWIRIVVNVADFFLANLAALGVYRLMMRIPGEHASLALAGGAAAGATSYVVNYAILAIAVRLDSGMRVRSYLRTSLEVMPYDVAYGVGAAGFAQHAGGVALVAWLVPVISLQGFLLVLARRTNAAMEERERHARERVELLQRVITVADAERTKAASDLHDGPVAHLSGLAMLLSAGAANVANVRTTMLEVSVELREVQRDLRSLIFQLSPHDLHEPGRMREEIVTKLLQPLQECGIETRVDVPDIIPLDRAGLELLHRVCAETLANIQRHAQAKHVDVALHADVNEVVLTIDDDGRGFSPDDVARKRADGHFGMRFLEEKAEVAHGSLAIASEPGRGTHVQLRLPIQRDRTALTDAASVPH